MAHGPRYHVKFRRRREGRTDYKKRLALLKSGKTRAVVRRQNNTTIVQFIDYDPEGDIVRAQATSRDLESQGYQGHPGNLPAAFLTGLLAGSRAAEAGIEEAVLDIGPHNPQPETGIFAALKGVIEAGIDVPHSDHILPEDERLTGEHISDEVAANVDEVRTNIQEAES